MATKTKSLHQKTVEITQIIMLAIIRTFTIMIIAFLIFILTYIILKGMKMLNPEFLLQPPSDMGREGGIFPAIVGTFWLIIGTTVISVPIGVITAIYLNEYATNYRLVKIIRMGINNLAGVPSVVFGLFGMSLFVNILGGFFNFGPSILAGSLTLGLLNLPVIIRATEEALKTVPDTYREASLALAATKLQTIIKIVLPNAAPGILTGVMLSLGRAAGETAPIMFTCATFFAPRLPSSVFSEIMALPYHIYVLAANIPNTLDQQFGTALVLILLVLVLNLTGIIMRYRFKQSIAGR
jgi:phosphate transport system permease protein